MKKFIIITSVLIFVLLLFFYWYFNFLGFMVGSDSISANQCTLRGGEIINTLSQETCPEGTKILAEVHGMRCPCICCVTE